MEKKFALLIDGDNISPKFLEGIVGEVSKEGDIHVRRVYGDWTTPNMNGWKGLLTKIPIRPVQQFRYGDNATDNTIIMEAIELANNNRAINAVCIASTDSDYYSLALKLREYGLYVLGIGKRNAREIWVSACNEFKYIENIETEHFGLSAGFAFHTESDAAAVPGAGVDAVEEDTGGFDLGKLVAHAYRNSRMTEEGWVSLSNLGKSLRITKPEFDPRSYNHSTLREMVEALPELFEVQSDRRIPPNYWVRAVRGAHKRTVLYGVIKRFRERDRWGVISHEELGDFRFVYSNLKRECRATALPEGTTVSFSVFRMPNDQGKSDEERHGRAADVLVVKRVAG
ncbi:NYN domain-containing protein [Treponema pallidum]|uniref:HTH OST-type domain-containing protein n=1 Tax=Treponema pallidum subsp. endemicum str. Bosnia A TaxID=1155776 RepID=A0AAU8RRS1_TREPL|nr:NYN domain-containing protein [Treponema pallidum]AJB40925.1 hypothetical protein TENDBA_0894 [Treponema pallidum subsp. endemicum str. Bosnia A]QBC41942.1 hypothetical protein TENDIB_0894 [Treponema pallidum subsp. endemicum]QUL04903.1 NYN domain-containing protein [Treponema pallidum]QUL24204.1 NYN domain-containing protein [Treponema pallidum]QUL27098.1 NYN domain-containing protein [Treponema pallidum]